MRRAAASVMLTATVVRLDPVRVGRLDVLSGVFPCVDKGMHTMPLVTRVTVRSAVVVPTLGVVVPLSRMMTGVGVVLVRLFVPVLAVPVMLVLHRRMTSTRRVMHGAADSEPLCVSGLRQLLMLVDRATVRFFRHGF